MNYDINPEDVSIETNLKPRMEVDVATNMDTSVRITYKPCGVVVEYDSERSQLKSKEMALQILKRKLIEMGELKMKNFVEISVGYYSDYSEYCENVVISEETYEKIKDELGTECYCGELDGKHSECMGEIEIEYLDEEYLKEHKVICYDDGDYLFCQIRELVSKACNVNYYNESAEFIENEWSAANSLYKYEDVEVKLKLTKEKAYEFKKLVENFKEENNIN